MRTVIYTRKSTLKEGQKDTLENQIKICRRRAKELGLTIVDVKGDTATGTDDNNREEVKELIKGAMDGLYDCVIMKGVSRFYRDVEKGLGLIKKLDRSNIRVITVEENFDSFEKRTGNGQLDTSMITMYLMFAENESKKLADRIKHTQIEKAHAGEWNQAGSIPFGYVYNKATKKLKVDYSSSETIKMIFNLYLSGMGMKSIAQYLNGDNEENVTYPSPKGKRWSQYTIGFMLKNRVYAGCVIYNKRSKNSRPYKNPESLGKTDEDVYIGNDYNDEAEWIITENAHEAIIDIELFEKVQNVIDMKAIRKGVKNSTSLLASLAKCGKCGSGMTFKRGNKDKQGNIRTKSNYYCSDYIKYGNQYCTSHHIGAEEFEEFILSNLQNAIDSRLNLHESTSNLKSKTDVRTDSINKNLKKAEKDIAQLSRKMNTLLEKNIGGTVSDNQFKMLNEQYSTELDLLVNQLEKLKASKENASTNETNNDYLFKKFEEARILKSFEKEKQRYILLDLIQKVTFNQGDVEIIYNF